MISLQDAVLSLSVRRIRLSSGFSDQKSGKQEGAVDIFQIFRKYLKKYNDRRSIQESGKNSVHNLKMILMIMTLTSTIEKFKSVLNKYESYQPFLRIYYNTHSKMLFLPLMH
jgi:hypothetical protein